LKSAGYSQGNRFFPPKTPEDFGLPGIFRVLAGPAGAIKAVLAFIAVFKVLRTDKWVY
jgi:hypothetical protein